MYTDILHIVKKKVGKSHLPCKILIEFVSLLVFSRITEREIADFNEIFKFSMLIFNSFQEM